nr:MAG TPA: hypothetical protein [Caudoviricetes sp.]
MERVEKVVGFIKILAVNGFLLGGKIHNPF